MLTVNRACSISLFSHVTFSNPFSVLAALHWTHSSTYTKIFFSTGKPRAGHSTLDVTSPASKWRRTTSLTSLLHACYYHSGCCQPSLQEGTACLCLTVTYQDTQILLCKAALYPVVPQPTLVHEVIPACTRICNCLLQLTGPSASALPSSVQAVTCCVCTVPR